MRVPLHRSMIGVSMEVPMHGARRRPVLDPRQGTPRSAWRRISRRLPALALAVAVLVDAGAASAWLRRPDPAEIPAVQVLRVTPIPTPAEAAPAEVVGLLSTPAHWDSGDAAVVLVGTRFPAPPLQQRLVEALLAEGAAVLELDTDAARGASVDSGVMPAPTQARSLLPDLFGALAALRRESGAGIAVVIGLEEAGEAALLATAAEATERRLPAGMRGFAAGIALGPGEARFVAGARLPPAERWEARAPLFCEALAWSIAAPTLPDPGFAPGCTAALGAAAGAVTVGLRAGSATAR